MIIISAQAFPPSSGGIQTLMAGLACAASAHEDVAVLADGKRDAAAFDKASNPPYAITRFGGIKPLRRRVKAKAAAKMCENSDVTHVFCDSWKSAEHLPATLSVPIIIYAHGNEYSLAMDDSPKKHRRILHTLSKADHVIAVSSQTAERVKRHMPKVSPPALHIRPNPVESPPEASAADIEAVEAMWSRLDPAKRSVRLLCLCRLIDWKGIDTSLKAVKDLRETGHDISMIIAGKGPQETALKAMCKQLGLDDVVHFAGRTEGGRKTALYESADIFMQPGRRIGDQCEGFGITYIEAGLHGLPSLSGSAGGAPDAVKHEITGLTVDGDNQASVNAALARLIDEPARAHHMGSSARSHAQTLLWDKQIGQILNLTAEK